MRTASHTSYTSYLANGQINSGDDGRADNTCSFSLGSAARYVLTPRLELTADVVVNTALSSRYYYCGSFGDRLFLTAQIGAHYAFSAR